MTADNVNKQARRQAQLRAKAAAREQKKKKRTDAALICPPDAAGRSLKMRLLGYICRVPVMLCAVAGLGTLINSAKTEDVASAYAATYPIALIAVVLASQLIIVLF